MSLLVVTALTLALQAASPSTAQPATPAPSAEAPTSTAPGAQPSAQDTPSGAPTDDYGFVAWCRGALTGHMELYPTVKPELIKLEHGSKETAEDAKLDEEQMTAGREYLTLYTQALAAAEKASGPELHARGEDAQAQGYRIWSAARAADDRTRMWSWVMWELPARCETAARKLQSQSALFGEAFRKDEAPAAAPTASQTAAPK